MLADVKLEAERPETVRAFPVLVRPEPKRLLKDSPFTMRLVVEAVLNDEYAVDEEYGKERADVVAEIPSDGWVQASYEVRPVAEVRKPESLLNQESCTEEDAMVFTFPFVPV